MTRTSHRGRVLLNTASALILALTLAPAPANAQLVVVDPNNLVENVLQAAYALEQVNNQIVSLQNEAQMLINEAHNLANLPYSALQEIEQSIAGIQDLLGQAQNIAYNVAQIEDAFGKLYTGVDINASDQALIEAAQTRWKNSVGGFEDALKVQAGAVEGIDVTKTQLGALVGSSQSAEGALQAAQASNQILALQAKQLSELTAVVTAQSRAQSLDAARLTANEDQAREQFRRFLENGKAYEPAPVQMFQGH